MAKSKNPDAVALGALGGKKGGPARAAAARWGIIKEDDYDDIGDFYQALRQKEPIRAVYPLPNRSVKILYHDRFIWIIPLKLDGRNLVGRIFAPKIDENIKLGQVICVDVTQILKISGKRLDQTDQIVGDILAKAT